MAIPYSKEDSTRHSEREKKEPKQKKPIKKVSEKMKQSTKLYLQVRKKYLEAFPVCEVVGCNKEATTIHHKAGRIGALLVDSEYFLACCMSCHLRIEQNPNWAKIKGYSLNRL